MASPVQEAREWISRVKSETRYVDALDKVLADLERRWDEFYKLDSDIQRAELRGKALQAEVAALETEKARLTEDIAAKGLQLKKQTQALDVLSKLNV